MVPAPQPPLDGCSDSTLASQALLVDASAPTFSGWESFGGPTFVQPGVETGVADPESSLLALLYSDDLYPVFGASETDAQWYDDTANYNLPLLPDPSSNPPAMRSPAEDIPVLDNVPTALAPPNVVCNRDESVNEMTQQGEKRRRNRDGVDERDILPEGSRRTRGKSARLMASELETVD